MDNKKREALNKLDIQIVFIGAIVVAASMNVYITLGYKDLILKEKNSKFTIKKLYRISLLSSTIFLIVTIYFFIDALDNYEKTKENYAFDFYMATVLSFVAQSIRVSTLRKYPDKIFGVEDVI